MVLASTVIVWCRKQTCPTAPCLRQPAPSQSAGPETATPPQSRRRAAMQIGRTKRNQPAPLARPSIVSQAAGKIQCAPRTPHARPPTCRTGHLFTLTQHTRLLNVRRLSIVPADGAAEPMASRGTPLREAVKLTFVCCPTQSCCNPSLVPNTGANLFSKSPNLSRAPRLFSCDLDQTPTFVVNFVRRLVAKKFTRLSHSANSS